MHIAMIGLRGVPARYSGIERAVEEIGARLAARGHMVTVYCMSSRYETRQREYRGMRLRYVPTVPSKNLEMIVYAVLSAVRASFSAAEIVHFHALGPSTMAWLPRLLFKKTVSTVHGLDWQRAKWGFAARRYLRFGEWAAARLADTTIVVSRTLERYFSQKYRRTVFYVPNGIFPARRRPLEAARDRFGIEADRYVLFVGRLTKEKYVHGLIDAFRKTGTGMRLVIVGGSVHTDGYVEALRRQAAGDGRIVFTGPIYDGTLMEELYSNAYLFVLPSDMEGLPVVLLEALSYGNAVLVSDIPENLEVIRSEGQAFGFSFSRGDAGKLRDRLEELLERPEIVRHEKARDFKPLLERYDWDSIARQTEERYRSVATSTTNDRHS